MILSVGLEQQKREGTLTREKGFPCWVIGILAEGAGVFRVGDKERLFRAPGLFLMPPFTVYDLSYRNKGKTWREGWAFFTPRSDWHHWLDWPVLIGKIRSLDLGKAGEAARFFRYFEELHQISLQPVRIKGPLLENKLEQILLLAQELLPSPAARVKGKILQAIDLFTTNLEEPLDLRTVARAVHMSPSHFSHQFQQQVGVPPIRFREQQRLERARHLLLATDDSIAEIGRKVGFDNAFHFTTRFKKYSGMSPRGFRSDPRLPWQRDGRESVKRVG